MTTSAHVEAVERVEAVLVFDNQDQSTILGVRDVERLERRLMFRSPKAHIEVRIPPAVGQEADERWLYGQYVDTGKGSAGDTRGVEVSVGDDRGAMPLRVLTGDNGDFAVPCDTGAPFWLEFRPQGGRMVVRAHVTRAS
jgi:hypothetical protein